MVISLMGEIRMIKAGTKFYHPDGNGGYEFPKDVHYGDVIRVKAFGGVPQPTGDEQLPAWFVSQLPKGKAYTE